MNSEGTLVYATPKRTETLLTIIRNDDSLYAGNLTHYYRIVVDCAQNLQHPYHNFRHMFHVLWMCYQACKFYRNKLDPRHMRILLIAALFHDFDHTGMSGDDDLNIARAIRGLSRHILSSDKPDYGAIIAAMRATQYPHVIATNKLDLCGMILREADMSQALDSAWIQQVVFGLADEWRMKPIDMLRRQESFLKTLSFRTDWARHQFPQSGIEARIQEIKELCQLLETND